MTVPREGLVLELLFDGNADDTSGGGHHGVVHGASPTADRFGNPAGALLFNGANDHVVVPSPPALGAHAFTVSLWARVDTGKMQGWSNCFICQDNGDDVDQSRRIFQLSVLNGRVVWHRMTCARDAVAQRFIVPGAWLHISAVVDGPVHRLYIDGELQDSVKHSFRTHADEPIYIGRKGTSEPSFFVRGAIDDARVYDRALAGDQILMLYREHGYISPVAENRGIPPISGMWGPHDEALLDLRFDGRSGVTGAVIAGQRGNLAAIESGTFDLSTGRLRLEGHATRPDNGVVVSYDIEGTLSNRRLAVRYRFGDIRGEETVRDVARWRALRRGRQALGQWARRRIEPVAIPLVRWLGSLRRPSREGNARRLEARGESTAALVFRDAKAQDIPALAALHVKTWAATYPGVRRPPTYAIREWQWQEAFAKQDGNWFCIVIENARRELIGFAKGVKHASGTGDLNKIYLLTEYQRLGLGRRLVGHVVRRFLESGISTMTLSADEANPSCAFYLALGAENPRDPDGHVHRGAFVWRDLPKLAEICPVDSGTNLQLTT